MGVSQCLGQEVATASTALGLQLVGGVKSRDCYLGCHGELKQETCEAIMA